MPTDIGLVSSNRNSAPLNTARLSRALATGRTPAIEPGTYYINAPIETKPVVGCGRITTSGSSGYAETDDFYKGSRVKIINLGKGPCLRLSGAGFVCEDPIEWEATDETAAVIEVEGRDAPSTGRHSFRHQIFRGGKCGAKALAGYYKDGQFVKCENHGESCRFYLCEFVDNSGFRIENQQALGWLAEDCSFVGLRNPDPITLVDCARGGCFTLIRPYIGQPRATVFRLWDDDVKNYAPNAATFYCEKLHVDRFVGQEFYTTLVSYKGNTWPAMRSIVEIQGFIPTRESKFDQGKLVDVPSGMPREGWKIDVETRGLDRKAD